MMKPLLIGQAPGPNTDPRLPLYPLPRTSTGGRLADFMGLTTHQYLRTFDRCNVLQEFPGKVKRDDKFPLREARIAANAMAPLLVGRQIICVGRNVGSSFGWSDLPFHTTVVTSDGTEWTVVPHASGRNHWYNKEENRMAARAFWAEFLATRGLPVMAEQGNLGAVGLEMAS